MHDLEKLQLELARREGEILLLKRDLVFKAQCAEIFHRQLWFWRSKYLKDHPELDNWEYSNSAYVDESGEDFNDQTPPSESR